MSITAQAPVPSRATNTITLGFGLVSIPLSVYSGTEDTRVSRKEFFNVPDGPTVAVGRAPIRKDTGDIVDNDRVVRMAQADSGSWVVLSDDEIAAATSPKGVADVECFVPLADLSRFSAENVVQVRPKADKGKVNPATDRAFAVLLAGMAKRKVGALVKVAMRGPARYAILTPEASLILIRTADGVREARPAPSYKPSKAEVNLAVTLIDALGIDTPTLTDDTAATVQHYVNAKAKGIKPPTPPTITDPQGDLMDALAASVAAKKGKVA